MNGRGRLINSYGHVYVGYWTNNQTNGYGEYTENEGSTYKGQWLKDKKHG